ncbi:hypothetical protein [Clostridium estertheticum]|uniref:hypothetical protein n=1 Tax=Clostridium estertheticum TaxID=238834 RepID=UPI001CF3D740|nr:hypothetical protein [Clostridium estertheticum]MCB2358740.1 hypothetical protein [Clostridium estertheticum]
MNIRITMLYKLVGDVQGIIEILIVTIQTTALIISIFPVEKALKKNFDEHGNRRY